MMSEAYQRAGVNISAGDEAVERYRDHVARTWRPEVLTNLGGFGGAFAFDKDRYAQPVLVSGTDGVGTKLKIAFEMDRHDTVGVDCVAMCVNDILVMGAEPLFFLDYFATGALDVGVAEQVVRGVAEGCKQAGCALIGGETAEMPGIYAGGEYDLAGFAVGVVDREHIIDGRAIAEGDVVLGLASSGLHSNGYSLVRRLIAEAGISLNDPFPPDAAQSLGEVLLTPTRIYAKAVRALQSEFPLAAMAHITGGGITGNLPRILHGAWDVELTLGSWPVPPIFSWLADLGALESDDLFATFNMGLGLVLIVPERVADGVIGRANALGERASRIGVVRRGAGKVALVGTWR